MSALRTVTVTTMKTLGQVDHEAAAPVAPEGEFTETAIRLRVTPAQIILRHSGLSASSHVDVANSPGALLPSKPDRVGQPRPWMTWTPPRYDDKNP